MLGHQLGPSGDLSHEFRAIISCVGFRPLFITAMSQPDWPSAWFRRHSAASVSAGGGVRCDAISAPFPVSAFQILRNNPPMIGQEDIVDHDSTSALASASAAPPLIGMVYTGNRGGERCRYRSTRSVPERDGGPRIEPYDRLLAHTSP
jgi:hypothetical protein